MHGEPFAAAIAARLQDAHERRRAREQGREDGEDMSENESVWTTQLDRAIDLLGELRGRALAAEAPGEPQASVVSAERVVELERKLAELDRDYADAVARGTELEKALDERERWLQDAHNRLATAYVQHDVPWTDVAAGTMTISAQGAPFLAEEWIGVGAVRLRGLHEGKVIAFEKAVDASKGETVKVLVPYVAPGAAEHEIAEQLGGTAVS